MARDYIEEVNYTHVIASIAFTATNIIQVEWESN